jgi:DNA-binding CsgD family transcriptional regulator
MTEAGPAAGRISTVVGRESELARIEWFVAGVSDGPRALMLRGEPGIGKTTLWRHAIEGCRARGHRVLVTRPAEEEMPLALVGLLDLFEHVDVDRSPLSSDDDPVRGRAVLAAIRRLAETGPTVLAIDDLQWLDSTSARALRHTMRRLETEPVGVLATSRPGTDAGDPLAVVRTWPPGRFQALDVGPLGLEDLRQVLAQYVASISRPVLHRIHEVSGGNPLYAIELARELAAGAGTPSEGLSLPDSLQAAIARRLDAAPEELEPLLQTAAALGPTSVRDLREALPDVDADRLLALAREQGILVVEEDLQVRFSHPLLGSAVYARIGPLDRHALHAWLADRALDEDVRARHLALSTEEPREDVAALLEEAADRADRRGASDLAAEFARHSRRLTPPDESEASDRRALAEIHHRGAAGEVGRAMALARDLWSALPPGPTRANVAIQLFFLGDDLDVIEERLERGLEDAGDDALLRGEILDLLGWQRGVFRGDLAAGISLAERALALAEGAGGKRLEMTAASSVAVMANLGGSPRPDVMARAVALAEELGGPRLSGGPRVWMAKQLLWSGDIPNARAIFEDARDDFVRAGTELQRPYRLFDLALVECAAGNMAAADALVREGLQGALDAENPHAERWLLHPQALVQAWQGRAKEVRETAGRLLEWAGARGERPGVVRARSVLGLLALSEGDTEAAARELVEAARLLEEMGYRHPGAFPVLPDAVEALAGSGELRVAEELFLRLDGEAAAAGPWALAAAERSRGVLFAARGDLEAAAESLARAEGEFERIGHRPDAARALLARGRALVRGGQRTLAADALAEARRRFAEMGAALWEARAAEELERVAPGRAAGELTPTERRVAALVAEGMKNRQIAQTLFLSVATVEAHLTRIYRKLDIGSRSELTRLVAEGSIRVSAD